MTSRISWQTAPPAALPDRRRVLAGLASLGVAACAPRLAEVAPVRSLPRGPGDPAARLGPLEATMERVFDVTVCLRPFRAAGPRIEVETIGAARVVHNYGHGGSGWSLAWGSSEIAVGLALASAPRAVAVIGCGPLGLTSALLAQAAGARVTIYARDDVAELTSLRATGLFSPDSRIALEDAVDPGFPERWEWMARTSFARLNAMLGQPGEPVRWIDRYSVADSAPSPAALTSLGAGLPFVNYGPRIRDLYPRPEMLDAELTPFRQVRVQRRPILTFNLTAYAQALMAQFLAGGGRFERREFRSPSEFESLPEGVVMNCTGYGARALMGDASVVPVRGQITWLTPQPDFDYALGYRELNVLPRSDGIAVQDVAGGDMRGYGVEDTRPDLQESQRAIANLAALYARFGA